MPNDAMLHNLQQMSTAQKTVNNANKVQLSYLSILQISVALRRISVPVSPCILKTLLTSGQTWTQMQHTSSSILLLAESTVVVS